MFDETKALEQQLLKPVFLFVEWFPGFADFARCFSKDKCANPANHSAERKKDLQREISSCTSSFQKLLRNLKVFDVPEPRLSNLSLKIVNSWRSSS